MRTQSRNSTRVHASRSARNWARVVAASVRIRWAGSLTHRPLQTACSACCPARGQSSLLTSPPVSQRVRFVRARDEALLTARRPASGRRGSRRRTAPLHSSKRLRQPRCRSLRQPGADLPGQARSAQVFAGLSALASAVFVSLALALSRQHPPAQAWKVKDVEARR